jgi:HxlR-like helix-turn-helix/SCP-2 sterol transfer family
VLCRAGEADQVALGVGEVADHEVSPRGLLGTHGALVADRLRELEGHGVIRRRKLAPPASSWVYELTEWGRKLEPIVLALGAWGVRAPLPPPPTALSATSVLLFLRACARPDPTASATTYRLELDDRVWTVRTTAGHVLVQPDEPAKADASLRATPTTFNALLDDPARLDAAMADGVVAATGDLSALRRLLQSVTNPSPVIR